MAQLQAQSNWRFPAGGPSVRPNANTCLTMPYHPVELYHPERDGRFVVVCDHATNTVPEAVAGGSLGLPTSDMERHIAFDIGAAGVSRRLADNLNASAVLSNFSRLVIDPNRGEDDPTLLMRIYDGSIIPANRSADLAEREHRMNLCYRPYHAELERVLSSRTAPVIISVHSFTPQLRGRDTRPWEVSILSAHDRRLGDAMLNRLRSDTNYCIGDNEPYSGHLSGDTIERHALAHGRHNLLIELRNDLISDEEGQNFWADTLAPLISNSLHDFEGS